MRRWEGDRVVSIVLIGVCVVLLILLPREIEVVAASRGLGPQFFSYLTVLGILGLSIILFVNSFRVSLPGRDKVLPKLTSDARLRVIFLISIVFGYIVALYEFGYYISTPLGLAILMRYFGMKKWHIIVIVCIGVTVLVHIIFSQAMDVILPEGRIFL